jgi:hypothetical protein
VWHSTGFLGQRWWGHTICIGHKQTIRKCVQLWDEDKIVHSVTTVYIEGKPAWLQRKHPRPSEPCRKRTFEASDQDDRVWVSKRYIFAFKEKCVEDKPPGRRTWTACSETQEDPYLLSQTAKRWQKHRYWLKRRGSLRMVMPTQPFSWLLISEFGHQFVDVSNNTCASVSIIERGHCENRCALWELHKRNWFWLPVGQDILDEKSFKWKSPYRKKSPQCAAMRVGEWGIWYLTTMCAGRQILYVKVVDFVWAYTLWPKEGSLTASHLQSRKTPCVNVHCNIEVHWNSSVGSRWDKRIGNTSEAR